MTYDEAKIVQLPFGKHQGRTLEEVLDLAPGYLLWMAENVTLESPVFKEAFETFMNDEAVRDELRCG